MFRSPFQTSYSQQSLNEQKASKLTSLASLQLTPTLMETKRKFITLQKSTLPLISPPNDSAHKQNQPKRGSHTIHLLSTRTLRNLRSTTTSTINGIAAAYNSMSSSNSQSTSNFSITTSLASIHRSHKKPSFSSSTNNKNTNDDIGHNFQKPANVANMEESASNYTNSDDEECHRDIEYEAENNEHRASRLLDDNYINENNENENLAVNLFPSNNKKKTMVSSQSIKNLKKKKLNQLLTASKSSIKRYQQDDTNNYMNSASNYDDDDEENEMFVNGGTNLKKTTDTDSMEFEQLTYESNEKLANCASTKQQHQQASKLSMLNNILGQSKLENSNQYKLTNKKLDTL